MTVRRVADAQLVRLRNGSPFPLSEIWPYQPHFELLYPGFMESGRDMNIIAAIVLPLDDRSLVKELRAQENALLFNKDVERLRTQRLVLDIQSQRE
jgi:hypothetical protein